MQVVKDKFTLLKDVPNVLNLSASVIKTNSVEGGPKTLAATLKLIERRINHFTKDKVFEAITDPAKLKKFHVVSFTEYNLPASYNKKTRGKIINLRAFGTDDMSRVDPRNIYASTVYAMLFEDLVTKKVKVRENQAANFINYFLAVFVRLFGKEYGLVGTYATEIPKLKFLLSCYILSSFFGMKSKKDIYKKSSTIATFNPVDMIDDLNKYDFSNILSFIKSLSDLRVMPGINQHIFTAKLLRHLTINFIPAIEDLSRCVSILTVSTLTGSTIVPTFIHTYNSTAFNNIVEIARIDFRRR